MDKPIRVIPAILTDDPAALETMARQTEGFTDYAQFDIMDGRFVPSISVTLEHIAALSIKFDWEAHLMVKSPESQLEGFQKAGAQKVVFHYEATPSPQEVISQAKGLGLKVGLAVNPETPVADFFPLTNEVDSVLLLTVNPGFYGSPFIPEVLEKATELRRSHPQMQIDIDGGIKESNIAHVARFGVDAICVGSAIFRQPQPGESYRRLLNLAREGAQQRYQ
ncbi:MAG TPA: ribulose-phosphate 3-epimerase [Dehalococcoidia bacterium]|nr:ribulose-phosphate 3-epimerase [Dehalococcoidia bacterium]